MMKPICAARRPQRAALGLRATVLARPLLAGLLALGGPAQAQTAAPAAAGQIAGQIAGPSAGTLPASGAGLLSPASSYLALGLTAYQAGHFDQAYVAFRAATESDPRSAEAWLGLGRTQARLRLYAQSQDSLQRLVQLDPGNLSAYVALAQTYTEQFAASTDRAAVAGNLAAALKVLQSAETAAQSLPKGGGQSGAMAKVWNQRSLVYKLQGDYHLAIAASQRASKLDPQNSVILFNLGDLYYASGNLSAAMDNLQQAVIADPSDAFNRAYYAKLLALSGNVPAAKVEAAQAANLSPQNAYVMGQYGVVSYLARDGATARSQLDTALKLDPLRYPEFYYYLGRLDLDESQLAGARSNFTKAVALASNNAEYLYYLGLSYERGGQGLSPDRTKARLNYQQALRLSPGYRPAVEALVRVK